MKLRPDTQISIKFVCSLPKKEKLIFSGQMGGCVHAAFNICGQTIGLRFLKR